MKKVAIYDLSYCPVTFDFIHFLANARLWFAMKTGDTSFDLIIIANEFRKLSPRDKAFDDDIKNWRIHNLLLPLLQCSPFVKSVQLLRERPESIPTDFKLYPPEYSLNKSHDPRIYFGSTLRRLYEISATKIHPACFQAPNQALTHARKLLNTDKPLAMISPRYSNFEPSRNTNMDMINELVEMFIKKGFVICFVHDQEDHGETKDKLPRHRSLIHIPEASFSIPLRIALMDIANINVFTPCALQGLAQLSKRLPNIVCFDMHKPKNTSFTGDVRDYKIRGGMEPMQEFPYPWSTPNMPFIWDKNVNVTKVFQKCIEISKFKRTV